jgi:hypothetical protein
MMRRPGFRSLAALPVENADIVPAPFLDADQLIDEAVTVDPNQPAIGEANGSGSDG